MTQESRLIAREQEQAVLGGLLISNDAVDRIGDLRDEHFWDAGHREIFKAILTIVMQNKTADVITVFERIRSNGKDVDLVYLNSLVNSTASAANIAMYASIVRDKAVKRGLLALMREMEGMLETSPKDSIQLVDMMASELEKLSQSDVDEDPVQVRDDLAAYIESIDERYHGGGTKAIPTGFTDLDARLGGGLNRGNLVVVAGRPKMGKSAFVLNLALNTAEDYGVSFLSMEMTKKEINDRNMSTLGKIELDHVINCQKLTDQDWQGLTRAVQKITNMNLSFYAKGSMSLMQVRNKAKKMKRRDGLDILIVDYLQLMNGEGNNRNEQIEGITRGLKSLAKELDIVVVLLSQLNRKLEERTNKRPMPADLRDSGSIEQDADIVMFLYRDEVYNPDSPDKGICEVNIALSRQAAPGIVPLIYNGKFVQFQDLARAWKQPEIKTTTKGKYRGFDDD